MPRIAVTTKRPGHRYDIVIESGLCAHWRDRVEACAGRGRFLVVADRNVAKMKSLDAELASEAGWDMLTVEPGETRKNLAQYAELCEKALALGIDRKSVVIAVGGGVTGDIAGFLAATLLRGIRFVQIPTTLLAQIDSSVGGKTGVNAAMGKNLIGAFHQPELVLIDPAFLDTLPEREYLAGLAEAAKYGVIADAELFRRVGDDAGRLAARDHGLLTEIIERCCRIKADIVSADETEKGRRALLNFGHTFGHAIEALAEYDGSVVHGEAVSVGMALAAQYAEREGMLSAGDSENVQAVLGRLGLPTRISDLDRGVAAGEKRPDWSMRLAGDRLVDSLLQDKKSDGGRLVLILPTGIGTCEIVKGVAAEKVADFMRLAWRRPKES